jgi:hypothetical protein
MAEAMSSKEADAATIGRLFEAALIQGSELWINTQKELLANIGAMLEDWLQLNRATLDTSSRTLRRLHEWQSLAGLFRLQQEWASDYWQWTAAAVPAAVDAGTRTARETAVRSREPAEAARTDIRVRREPATESAAKTTTTAE